MNKGNKIKTPKKPWPTKAVMKQIYEKNLWGTSSNEFYSGFGSHYSEIVNPYINVLVSFLKSFETPLVVCDLGCGDFNVGKQLVKHTKNYIGVDIVTELIEHNKDKFKEENLEFYCLDIAVDDLPSGDCALLRQVLQHLSNSEVHRVLKKLSKYRYVILTEHLPTGDFIPNKDIITGQGIRLKKHSGIDLLVEPFNLKIKEEKKMLSNNLGKERGVIITKLYEM